MNFAVKLTNMLNKRKILILVLWVTAGFLLIGLYAGNFFNVTTNEFNAPEGTDAYNANKLIETYFPQRLNEFSHLIVLENPSGSILGPDLAQFTQSIVTELQSKYSSELTQIAGYYVFEGTELDFLKFEFLSEDLTTSIISYTINAEADFQVEVTESLRHYIDTIAIPGINIFTVGQSELDVDTTESIEKDLATIDSIVIPLVFIALIIILRNWRYFPITVIPIFMTILISFGILERYIVLTDSVVQSFVPSVLISLTLGIGVDYNLFLLTRFQEERKKGNSVLNSVTKMMEHAGHSIFTSGVTLIIALAALAFFPVSVLSSVGIAISVSITVLLAMNLTFTPALLLLIGGWVEKEALPVPNTKPTSLPNDEKSSMDGEKSKRSRWYRIGIFSTKRNFLILVVVLMITLPLSIQVLNSTPDNEMAFFAPRGSSSAAGFEILQDQFGPGSIGPTNLVLIPASGDVWSPETFMDIQNFIQTSITNTDLNSLSFQSHTFLGGDIVPQDIAMEFIDSGSQLYNTPDAQLYRQFGLPFVSEAIDGVQAIMIDIVFPIDPASPAAKNLLKDIEQIASTIFGNNYQYGFAGYTANLNSIVDTTYELFPIMILFVIIGIYILIGLMFRAVILPARLIATIMLTMSFIYGAATIIFEYTTFLNDIFPSLDAVTVTFWMVPIMSFSIILGLGIDYDVFTIERVREYVWQGMDNNEAIAEGLDKTGRIITGAGIIMTIAFGGMMFSSSFILVQFGFVLSFAVILDTFVVRTLLVPAIMSFAEKANWWPNLPPQYQSDKTPAKGKLDDNIVIGME